MRSEALQGRKARARTTRTDWRLRAPLLAVVAVLALPGVARAAPGDLDPAFSDDGWTTGGLGRFAYPSGVAIDDHNRIVVVARGGVSDPNFAIARFMPDGTPDSSFSGDGQVRVSFGGSDSPFGVAIDDQGRIVVVGASQHRRYELMATARLEPDGSLDRSFSGNGKAQTLVGERSSTASSVALDGQGRIVVAGYALRETGYEYALVRYTPEGHLDDTFSGDGKATTSFGGLARSVAIDGQGRIVVAGDAGSAVGVARFKPNGGLDTSFSGDGLVTTQYGSYSEANSVVIDEQDRPLIAGRFDQGTFDIAFGLARYTTNGSLDPSFSGDGLVRTSFDSAGITSARAVAFDPWGRIVAVGVTGQQKFALARYDPDGNLDPGFGENGKVTTAFGGQDAARAAAIDPNGRIIAVGSQNEDQSYVLARYLGGPPIPSG